MKNNCIVDGCEEIEFCKHLCEFHYQRLRNGKSFLDPRQSREIQGIVCSVPGCNEKPISKQMCKFHYDRNYNGLPLDNEKKHNKLGEKCIIEGCERKPIANQMCPLHYEREKYGRDLTAEIRQTNHYLPGDNILCTICNTIKLETDFPTRSNTINGRSRICIECEKIRSKNRYESEKEKFYIWNKNNRLYLSQEIKKIKAAPCKDCGIIYEPFCMEFDHIREKSFSISKMVHDTWSLEHILEEIEKTELVCVLCHRTRTHNRMVYSTDKTIERNRAFILEYKSQPCTICGNNFAPWQMEFDHIRGIKKAPISRMVASRYSIAAIQIPRALASPEALAGSIP